VEAIVKYKFTNVLEKESHIDLHKVFTTKHKTHVSQVIYFSSGVPPLFPEKARLCDKGNCKPASHSLTLCLCCLQQQYICIIIVYV
jgi:hypothetical protein